MNAGKDVFVRAHQELNSIAQEVGPLKEDKARLEAEVERLDRELEAQKLASAKDKDEAPQQGKATEVQQLLAALKIDDKLIPELRDSFQHGLSLMSHDVRLNYSVPGVLSVDIHRIIDMHLRRHRELGNKDHVEVWQRLLQACQRRFGMSAKVSEHNVLMHLRDQAKSAPGVHLNGGYVNRLTSILNDATWQPVAGANSIDESHCIGSIPTPGETPDKRSHSSLSSVPSQSSSRPRRPAVGKSASLGQAPRLSRSLEDTHVDSNEQDRSGASEILDDVYMPDPDERSAHGQSDGHSSVIARLGERMEMNPDTALRLERQIRHEIEVARNIRLQDQSRAAAIESSAVVDFADGMKMHAELPEMLSRRSRLREHLSKLNEAREGAIADILGDYKGAEEVAERERRYTRIPVQEEGSTEVAASDAISRVMGHLANAIVESTDKKPRLSLMTGPRNPMPPMRDRAELLSTNTPRPTTWLLNSAVFAARTASSTISRLS
jgi:hypothetical protein